MSRYDKKVRAAMKWWRATNPEKSPSVRVVKDPYAGHVLWADAWNAAIGNTGIVTRMSEVLYAYDKRDPVSAAG